MNAHAKPIHMIPRTALLGLEGPVNDLARLAHTTAIIAERVMKDLRGWAEHVPGIAEVVSTMEEDLEVLFAHTDDVDFAASDLRKAFYEGLK